MEVRCGGGRVLMMEAGQVVMMVMGIGGQGALVCVVEIEAGIIEGGCCRGRSSCSVMTELSIEVL